MDNPVITYVIAATVVPWLFAIWYKYKHYLHILQLEDYEPLRFFQMLKRGYRSSSSRLWVSYMFPGVFLLCTKSTIWVGFWIGLGLWIIGCSYQIYKLRKSQARSKKPLVMTDRASSILSLSIVLALLIPVSTFGYVSILERIDIFVIAMFISDRAGFLVLAGAVAILQPLERRKQNYYINDAKRILNEIKPLVIGITGSYGKTGTKEILSAMLSEKYNVYRPPGSYNTLMGVTRAIREGLRPQHEAFVVEMGAYRIGSIDKLCNLVNPTHGLITIIGVQHLERFGSQAAIQRAKGELIRSLPNDGIAVLNGDDPLCREIGDDFDGKVVYFHSDPLYSQLNENSSDSSFPRRRESSSSAGALDSRLRGNDESKSENDESRDETVSANKIKIGINGSDFDLCFPDGETLPAHLSLLGRSAIKNAIASAAMADQLGVKRRNIVRAMSTIPHVRHRLEPIKRAGGITVIDDAFNSNPIGVAGALEILAQADGRRILVTPGMIELGEIEDDENREFGRKAAGACDLAVLIGKSRVEPIKQGLIEGGFDGKNIWIEPSLNEALERLKSYLKPGDTMLLENDLPDQYNEM